jgi:protein-tyrosine phosphatase
MSENNIQLSYPQQALDLEGVANARELGGYVMLDGRKIRRGMLLRSGNLYNATEEDVAKLTNEYHVTRVFDFRGDSEFQMFPDRRIPYCISTHIPCINPDDDEWENTALVQVAKNFTIEQLVKVAKTDEAKQLTANMYPSLINSEYTRRQYGLFLKQVTNYDGGATLWHCSQGKDRAGWGAAFVLGTLGASRELIIADFDLSNIFYQDIVNEIIEKLIADGGTDADVDVIRAFVGCSKKNFIYTFDLIEKQYGSLLHFIIHQLGLSESEIEKMRTIYLE